GWRGLPSCGGLAAFLAEHRGKARRRPPVPLTVERVLGWADAHRRRTGEWPCATSGAAADAPQEDWRAIDAALRFGFRGLPGGSSLATLLERRRGRQRQSWKRR